MSDDEEARVVAIDTGVLVIGPEKVGSIYVRINNLGLEENCQVAHELNGTWSWWLVIVKSFGSRSVRCVCVVLFVSVFAVTSMATRLEFMEMALVICLDSW